MYYPLVIWYSHGKPAIFNCQCQRIHQSHCVIVGMFCIQLIWELSNSSHRSVSTIVPLSNHCPIIHLIDPIVNLIDWYLFTSVLTIQPLISKLYESKYVRIYCITTPNRYFMLEIGRKSQPIPAWKHLSASFWMSLYIDLDIYSIQIKSNEIT